MAARIGRLWQLRDGDQAVGTIEITQGDMPWWKGTFTPAEGFDAVRDIFERLSMLVGVDVREGEYEAIWDELNRRLTLVKPSGTAAAYFMLHIRGDRAYVRYTDKPPPV